MQYTKRTDDRAIGEVGSGALKSKHLHTLYYLFIMEWNASSGPMHMGAWGAVFPIT